MNRGFTSEARARASRWLEEGQSQLALVLGILNDRLRAAAEAAESEVERLRGASYENERLRNQLEATQEECQKLREEIGRLRGEAERQLKEREEVAASLSNVMNEVLLRLRGQPA